MKRITFPCRETPLTDYVRVNDLLGGRISVQVQQAQYQSGLTPGPMTSILDRRQALKLIESLQAMLGINPAPPSHHLWEEEDD